MNDDEGRANLEEALEQCRIRALELRWDDRLGEAAELDAYVSSTEAYFAGYDAGRAAG
ncbi:MAG: hypothetical protein IVW52_12810 [Acidimicrobiales bacterium]|nr:hypothetical protein [Acidimicrobiales bacterium]